MNDRVCDHAEVVWKFPLKTGGVADVEMPNHAKVLTAQAQGEEVQLWVAVHPSGPTETRRFGVFPTGGPLPPGPKAYVSTVLFRGGTLVFHVFELGSPIRRLL